MITFVSKVNVIPRLEFELTYFESAVKLFSHYDLGTPPPPLRLSLLGFFLPTFISNIFK